ncbi:Tetratricopeptide-like helical [Cordyceps fumosorosea ARSEF 2679]|uniref:Tetratricopeptide-like helical n=1 Tax=Cordyceps fumosorosea (strain ARSEF 2679) TaxID=1081104 RepID=A0A166XXU9_CORFA|nr:Tetratricopeptide-like helical [Cordyceps fumosorosea ARSEF 2679]OAA36312.1 Tetratricopeptide-like helical [Cordyceps fumosorosea ARSEF 2679]
MLENEAKAQFYGCRSPVPLLQISRRKWHPPVLIGPPRALNNGAAIDELHSTVFGKTGRIFGHGHWNTVNARLEYGQLLRGKKRYEQAESLYRTFIDEMDRDGGPESVAVLCIFNALGTVYAKRQKLKEAEAILVRAVAGFRTQSGDRDERTLTAAFNLGGVYQDREKLCCAISMYHGAAYVFKDVMGISDKTTIAAFTSLAALCSAGRALPEAEEAYNLALRGLEEAARQSSMDDLILKLDLGVLYRDVGRLGAAEKLTREVYQGLKDARSGHAAAALTCLGTVYARQGRAAEAETSLSDALKDFATCETEYSATAYAASFSLDNLLRSHRRLAEAEAMYQRAWSSARSVGGLQHATSCTVADALSSLYKE